MSYIRSIRILKSMEKGCPPCVATDRQRPFPLPEVQPSDVGSVVARDWLDCTVHRDAVADATLFFQAAARTLSHAERSLLVRTQ